jgi:23S rRNA (guanosine2251-2'-O)-methyltransferase
VNGSRSRSDMQSDLTIVGVRSVQEALVSGERPIARIYLRHGALSENLRKILELANERRIPVRREDRRGMDREAGGRLHQGVVAVGGQIDTVPLAAVIGVPSPLILVLDEVEDPQNLGSIVRTAETAGVTGVVMPERRSAPLSAAVSRASAGAIEHVAVTRVNNLVSALKAMKKKGIWVVGVDERGERLWKDFDYRVPLALVLGGEHRGIRRLVREHCDATVRLPLGGRVASLNVSVAAGAVLFEAVRQRLVSPPDRG